MGFQLYLLTKHYKQNQAHYAADLITDFENQVQNYKQNTQSHHSQNDWLNLKYPHGYTYNENFKIGLNSKRTLTFSLDKKIFINQDWIDNPFVNNLQIGSLLLLVDPYQQHHVFIITDIKYAFGSLNITYNISCEDLFSYTTCRLNSGYEITNDPTSEDFIGAKTIDYWVQSYIAHDCYLYYKYLSLGQGLYKDNNNNYRICSYNTNIEQVKDMIKDAYSDREDVDLYEKILFTCSNSSANGALTSLGDKLDLQIRVFEHLDFETGFMLQYFWFEPKKNNNRVSGLTYSPTSSINSFSLSHSGKSLTTVLNVTGPTFDDEIVSLIPSLTPFFFTLFQSRLWNNSNYSTGSFKKWIKQQDWKGIMFHHNEADIDVPNLEYVAEGESPYYLENTFGVELPVIYNNGTLKFKIENTPLFNDTNGLLYLYPRINFNNSVLVFNEQWTESQQDYTRSFTITPYTHIWNIVAEETLIPPNTRSDLETIVNQYVLNTNTDLEALSSDKYYIVKDNTDNLVTYSRSWTLYLVINNVNLHTGATINIDYSQTSFNLHLTRLFTDDDYKFADAADKCPWLENKLIDFTYFKDHNLISNAEYTELIDTIYNNLRIVNGQLLCYAQAYYEAVRAKTVEIAALLNNFESLGAACEAAIITPYQTTRGVSDYSYFNSAYMQVFNSYTPATQTLLGYNNLVTDYFNKYKNAQQRFLKNIYAFRNFFDTKVSIPGDGIYTYNIQLDEMQIPTDQGEFIPGAWSTTYYTFSKNNSIDTLTGSFGLFNNDKTSYEYGKPSVTIYTRTKQQQLNQYQQAEIVDATNYKNYFISNTPNQFEQNALFNVDNNYYQYVWEFVLPADGLRLDADHIVRINRSLQMETDFDSILTSYSGVWLLQVYVNNQWQWADLNQNFKESAIIPETDLSNIAKNGKYFIINQTTSYGENDGVVDPNFLYNRLKVQMQPAYVDAATNSWLNCSAKLRIIPASIKITKTSTTVEPNLALYINLFKDDSTTHGVLADSFKTIPAKVSRYDMINNYIFKQSLTGNISYNKKVYNIHTSFDAFRNVVVAATEEELEDKQKAKRIEVVDADGNPYKVSQGQTSTTLYIEGDPDSNYADPSYHITYSDIPWLNANNVKGAQSDQMSGAGVAYDTESYIENLPITELYYYGVKSTVQRNSDNTLSINYFDATNKQINQTNIVANSENQQFLPIHFVTHKNVSKYYKRVLSRQEFNNIYNSSDIASTGANNSTLDAITWANANSYGNATWSVDTILAGAKDLFGNDITYNTGFYKTGHLLYSPVSGGGDEIISNYNALSNQADIGAYGLLYSKTGFSFYSLYEHGALSSNTTTDFEKWLKSELDNTSKIYFEDCYWDLLTLDDTVSQTDEIYVLNLNLITASGSNIDGDAVIELMSQSGLFDYYNNNSKYDKLITDAAARSSGTVYYPITKMFVTFDTSAADWKEKGRTQLLKDVLTQIHNNTFFTISTPNVLTKSYPLNMQVDISKYGIRHSCLLFRKMNYQLEPLSNTNLIHFNFLQNNEAFDAYGLPVNWNNTPIAEGYMFNNDTEEAITPTEFNEYYNYFKIIDSDKRISVPTIWQAIQSNQYFVCQSQSNSTQSFNKEETSFPVQLYLHRVNGYTEVTEDGAIITIESDMAEDSNISHLPNVNWLNDYATCYLDDNTHFATITMNKNNVVNFQSMTNGQFWYRFGRDNRYPICYSHAAAIEAELTQYWMAAYNASKYCEYFLPDTWTQFRNQESNQLFNAIFTLNSNSISIAKNSFLPEVAIFERDGNSLLDNFRWHYEPFTESFESQSIDSTVEEVQTATIQDNLALQRIFNVLGEDMLNYRIEKIGKTVYYYPISGGVTWTEFLNRVVGAGYERYSGLYVMLYRKIKNSFVDAELVMYDQAKTAHDQQWRDIYMKFGHLILENAYKNEDATTSEELYLASKYYLLDSTQPERKYDVSISDLSVLSGYHGQELHIGDPITLDADEFYNQNDIIYKSLRQYLFISDLSYTLRDNSKLKITVNNIKYNDKLINRLAKLIK